MEPENTRPAPANTDETTTPDLSIVVALVSGAPDRLRVCLTALEAQRLPRMEILVPYDAPVADVVALGADFPAVRFVLAEGLDTAAARAGASREHHDTIRTVGLRRARGRVVAMLEDVGRPAPGWCKALLRALERHPRAGAVGGGMQCGSPRALNRAVCLADFWRYQTPLPEVAADYASDANIAYRRAALESVADAWQDDFHETIVNDALRREGFELWWTPEATIFQERGALGWREALRERYVWGRSYAGTRSDHLSLAQRVVYAALSPVLPFLLAFRAARLAGERGSFWKHCAPALPLALLLFSVWSLGEAVGYVSGRRDGTTRRATVTP